MYRFRWFIKLSTRQECRVLNKACVKLLECIFHRGGKYLLLFLLFSQDLTTAKLVFVVASLSYKKFNITGKHTNTTTKTFRTLEHREQIYRNELPKNIYDENNFNKLYSLLWYRLMPSDSYRGLTRGTVNLSGQLKI